MGKTYKVEILTPAQTELEGIAHIHMALSGPNSARNIMDAIYHVMEQLTRFPMSGPPMPDDQLRSAGYRYILANKYLVVYRFLGDTVVIYHIVHGATDYPQLLKGLLF